MQENTSSCRKYLNRKNWDVLLQCIIPPGHCSLGRPDNTYYALSGQPRIGDCKRELNTPTQTLYKTCDTNYKVTRHWVSLQQKKRPFGCCVIFPYVLAPMLQRGAQVTLLFSWSPSGTPFYFHLFMEFVPLWSQREDSHLVKAPAIGS